MRHSWNWFIVYRSPKAWEVKTLVPTAFFSLNQSSDKHTLHTGIKQQNLPYSKVPHPPYLPRGLSPGRPGLSQISKLSNASSGLEGSGAGKIDPPDPHGSPHQTKQASAKGSFEWSVECPKLFGRRCSVFFNCKVPSDYNHLGINWISHNLFS